MADNIVKLELTEEEASLLLNLAFGGYNQVKCYVDDDTMLAGVCLDLLLSYLVEFKLGPKSSDTLFEKVIKQYNACASKDLEVKGLQASLVKKIIESNRSNPEGSQWKN